MVQLPNEILNIIFSFVERPQTNKIMKHIIEKGFLEDANPSCKLYIDDSKFTFYNWYSMFILYQKSIKKSNKKSYCKQNYTHFPKVVDLGYSQFYRTFVIFNS